MEIYQLRTFVAVAREGSITRASELLYASQPAVSAHIKALEDELGLVLFERTPRGMSLTSNGVKLLTRAEQLLALHRDFLAEAKRVKGELSGTLRLGCNREPGARALGALLTQLAATSPAIALQLEYGNSQEIFDAITDGKLDAGFYITDTASDPRLETITVERFGIHLAAPPGWIAEGNPLDWQALAKLPWICPAANSCCGRAAEALFLTHGFRPEKIISVDQESVTRTLIAGGLGVGLLHTETANDAASKGEVTLLGPAQHHASLLFAYLANRRHEPLIEAVAAAVRESAAVTTSDMR